MASNNDTSTSTISNNDQNNAQRCFLEWMTIQEQELAELLQASTQTNREDNVLSQLTDKSIEHFQEYMNKRNRLAQNDVLAFFAPTWNSCLENSLLWVGGCRPSIFIRLLYALCGSQMESQLNEYLDGARTGNIGELSSRQLRMVNELHCKTIKEEHMLTNQLASLQENIADQPISVIDHGQGQCWELNEDVNRAFQDHEKEMVSVLQEADKLRLSTLKELINILTPVQAVDFLASGKKLHLRLHDWGKQRDHMHGRRN